MKTRMMMYDLARGRCYRKSFFMALLDRLQSLGYNQLLLYLEGAYQFDFLPVPWRQGLLSPADAGELSRECERRGIEIVPATNVYYHAEHFLDMERFQGLRDSAVKTGGQKQIDPLKPEVEELFRAVVEQLSRDFHASKVHIGGDEVISAPHGVEETRKRYSTYLSSLCRWMIAKELVPCVWGDFIFKCSGMLSAFPRQTVIYDWYYSGHRKQSLELFAKAGFDTIACVSDNSWWAPFNVQPRGDTGLKPGEIEAFIDDAREAGAAGAGITMWGLYYGTPFLPQLYPMARAALAMKGTLPDGEKAIDGAVHTALFGGDRNPLVALTRLIYETLYHHPDRTLRDDYETSVQVTFASCRRESLRHLLLEGGSSISIEIQEALRRTAEEMDQLVSQGREDDPFWRTCKIGFAALRERFFFCSSALGLARSGRSLYHEAALLQYDTPGKARALIEQVCEQIGHTQAALHRQAAFLDALVEEEGLSPLDPGMVRERASDLGNLARQMRERIGAAAPLPSWTGLVHLLFPESHPGNWLPA